MSGGGLPGSVMHAVSLALLFLLDVGLVRAVAHLPTLRDVGCQLVGLLLLGVGGEGVSLIMEHNIRGAMARASQSP